MFSISVTPIHWTPCIPWTPCGPSFPWTPCGPIGPSFPWTPWTPGTPCGPDTVFVWHGVKGGYGLGKIGGTCGLQDAKGGYCNGDWYNDIFIIDNNNKKQLYNINGFIMQI